MNPPAGREMRNLNRFNPQLIKKAIKFVLSKSNFTFAV
jgi:hypothetical protein